MHKRKAVFLPLEGVGKDDVIGGDGTLLDNGTSEGRGFPKHEIGSSGGTGFRLLLIASREHSRVRDRWCPCNGPVEGSSRLPDNLDVVVVVIGSSGGRGFRLLSITSRELSRVRDRR